MAEPERPRAVALLADDHEEEEALHNSHISFSLPMQNIPTGCSPEYVMVGTKTRILFPNSLALFHAVANLAPVSSRISGLLALSSLAGRFFVSDSGSG